MHLRPVQVTSQHPDLFDVNYRPHSNEGTRGSSARDETWEKVAQRLDDFAAAWDEGDSPPDLREFLPDPSTSVCYAALLKTRHQDSMSEFEKLISVCARTRFKIPDSITSSTAGLKFSTPPSTSTVGLLQFVVG